MEHATVLIAFSALFLAGLALEAVGHRIHVPRVTLLILMGTLVGPSVLDLLPTELIEADSIVTPTALTMVAFLLGSSLRARTLMKHGREILIISLSVVAVSVTVVAGGLALLGVPLAMALLLGGISAATAPAATMDVIRDVGRTGRFVDNLRGIVAIDDAWGLIVFSILMTFAGMIAGDGDPGAIFHGLREAAGSILLGLAVGLPGALLTGRIKPGEPTLIEALALVFLTAGVALMFGLSFLLAGMVAGALIANLAHHHDRPFHEIERIEWPFLLIFFVIAGASLDLSDLEVIGPVCLAYIGLRAVSRVSGGWLGGRLAGVSGREGALTGLSMMPQAGVAVGMALVVVETFPQMGETILAITIASTIAFEVFGPLMALYAIKRVPPDPE